ncbi:MAG: alpha/beta fold hydrolase [Saprospiraceae bacterium]|nr:alpha/beta fold hydrolase [Saprospiraceae bacterium]
MPLIQKSTYPGPPAYQLNGHLQTILPILFYKNPDFTYQRERVTLPDNDFLDLDWLSDNNEQLAILTHGLEGNSDRSYVRSMAADLHALNWDILAWNCRSCSGEMNRALRLYYHGEIEDFEFVIRHALKSRPYKRIVLIGFSMGGAIQLKYLGVRADNVPKELTHAISISAPCDISKGVEVLEKPGNWMYRRRFFNSLKEKVLIKAARFPEVLDASKIDEIQSWREFDRFFSAPINGFKEEQAFYDSASAKNFMAGIKVPTLLLNALNDPILSENCYPEALCKAHPAIFLETPERGGHLGFIDRKNGKCWANKRTIEFMNNRF